MEEQIVKYLNGEIPKEALTVEELHEVKDLEVLDRMLYQQIVVSPTNNLADNIINKYKKSRSSWSWVKWWLVTVGVITALLALILPNFDTESMDIVASASKQLEQIGGLFQSGYLTYLLVFVNLITLLLILDKVLSKKLKLHR